MAVPLCRGDQSSLATAPEICDGAARLQVARGSAGGPGRWRTEAPAAKALCSSAPAAGGVLGRALSPLGPAVLVPLPYGAPGRRRGEQHSGRALTDAATTRASGRGGRAQAHCGCCGGGASPREPPLRLPCAAWWLRDQAGEGDAASGLGGAATQRHLPAARVCHLGPPLAVPPAPVTGSREEEPSLLTPIKLQARGHEWWWWFRAFPSLEVLYSATGVTGAVL